MKDFKSYADDGGNTYGKKNGNNTGGTDGGVENTVNLAAMLAKAFDGKSEMQILQTIIAQAEQGKRDGTLTNSDLDNFYNTLSPMLDGFKRQKLKGIIQKLKSI